MIDYEFKHDNAKGCDSSSECHLTSRSQITCQLSLLTCTTLVDFSVRTFDDIYRPVV
jgi:hypothetical protein